MLAGTFSRGQAVWFHLSNVELLRPVLVYNLHRESYRCHNKGETFSNQPVMLHI